MEQWKISQAKRDDVVCVVRKYSYGFSKGLDCSADEVTDLVLGELLIEVEPPKTDAEKIAGFVAALRRLSPAGTLRNSPMLADLILTHLEIEI